MFAVFSFFCKTQARFGRLPSLGQHERQYWKLVSSFINFIISSCVARSPLSMPTSFSRTPVSSHFLIRRIMRGFPIRCSKKRIPATVVCSGTVANLDFKAHPRTRQLVVPATSRRGSADDATQTLAKRADGCAADEAVESCMLFALLPRHNWFGNRSK